MLAKNNIAFKEWAVVCVALGSGRQTIILRKGGIDEGQEGFKVKYDEFWLLPTRFHEDASQLTADAQPLLQQAQNKLPPPGKFLVDLYVVVEEVFHLVDLSTAERLAGEHILSNDTIAQRFRYRQPGLFALAVRVYRVPTPYEVADTTYIAGCKSWVELPEPLATTVAVPILETTRFNQRLRQTRLIMTGNIYPCPCCGFMVFYEPAGSFEICPICFWEDDGVQLGFPDLARGANKCSLIEGQQNFAAFGACEERLRSHVRQPNQSEVRDSTWRRIDLETDYYLKWGRKNDHSKWHDADSEICLYYWKPEYWLNIKPSN